MGAFMKCDDIYIGSLIDLFNLRFAPTPTCPDPQCVYGGIAEMVALQKQFKIFKRGRRFSDSAALLGLGGFHNARAKNRWIELLRNLPDSGDQKIANALLDNFKKRRPLPCYMRAHLSALRPERRVIISEADRPLFYVEQQYLTISLPMIPRPRDEPKRTRTKR